MEKNKNPHPVHDLMGTSTKRIDGYYELDEFGPTSIRVWRGKIVETRAPGRPAPIDFHPSPRVEEMIAKQLEAIAELKHDSTNREE